MRMKLLLVTFSLGSQSKDYGESFVSLRGNALNWWYFIEQTYVVSAHYEANDFAQKTYSTYRDCNGLGSTRGDYAASISTMVTRSCMGMAEHV